MTLLHLWKTRYNYWLKLQQLKKFGTEHRIPQQITETKQSIDLLTNEIYIKINELRKHKNIITNP